MCTGEFDQIVVQCATEQEAVDVLAVVEAKRNVNDLVHGFEVRQENLAWLVGDPSGYVVDKYRTSAFPEGHFTGAVHVEQGRTYRFERSSFARFQTPNEQGFRLAGLWFLTQRRPLLGVTSSELGQILYQVSTNPSHHLASNSGLGKFRKSVLRFVSDFQTRNVLNLYAETDKLAQQIVFAD